jgi:glucosylglycerate synthase
VDADLIGLTAEGVAALLGPVLGGEGDFVSPAYTRSISEGTLTTTLLAPLTRALYGRRIQQVIGGCAGLAKGLIGRLLDEGPPRDALDGCGIEVWLPTGALAAAGRIVEVHLGRKVVAPSLAQSDLATTLARVVGPTFALMDRYADVWAGVRGSAPVPAAGERAGLAPETGELHLDRMVRAFRLGVKDLLPVWEQILPDETLGALFPLEIVPVEEFAFPPRLWARVVCDFAVAHHERRVARDHLLRALTPLYLGRVAAFLREAQMGPLDHVPTLWEETGRAFEAEADILRNRWR